MNIHKKTIKGMQRNSELRNIILTILLVFNFSSALASLDDRDKYDKEVERVVFLSKIAGTTWLYSWRGREYTFTFGPDGKISKLQSWSKVKWKINQKNEVILIASNQRMHLYFDSEVRNFTTVDWDGQKASGRFIFKDDTQ